MLKHVLDTSHNYCEERASTSHNVVRLDEVMTKFVLFLRGVNVSGLRIQMKDLTALLNEAGYQQVKTVLATGNVILQAAGQDASTVKEHCEKVLEQHFGRPVPLVVLSCAQAHELATNFPIQLPSATGEYHRYLSLCASIEDANQLLDAALVFASPQEVAVHGQALCWVSPKGQSLETPVSKLVTAQASQRFITTRNLNTLVKISTIIQAQSCAT